MSIAPGLVLGALLILIATQLVRITVPQPGPYPWTLLLATVGFVIGELIAAVTHAGGPSLGVLHPVADAISMALIEAGGLVALTVVRRRRTPP